LFRDRIQTKRWLRAIEIAEAMFWFEGYHTRYLEEIDEFIRRKRMYSPKIKEELIAPLYELSKMRKMPMARLVNRIIREYLKKNKVEGKKAEVVQNS